MDRVREILRALIRRALSEFGRDLPALVDVGVERAYGGIQPRLEARFANGYRVSAVIRAEECYGFCERNSAWDSHTLRQVLLREAQALHAQMLEAYMAEINTAELEQQGWIAERLSRLSRLFRRGLRPRIRNQAFIRVGRGFFADETCNAAEERGIRLLMENLSPAQLEQYRQHQWFDVIGGKTGRRYRIRYGRSMNIDQLDRKGRRVCGWCFFPEGRLVPGDVMLAQKLALELFEAEALEVANRL
jgi:hypothetical protein